MATPQDVIRVEASQVGYVEGSNNANKYGVWYGMNHQPWCDIFQSWAFAQAGALSAIGGKFASTPAHAAWFKAKGRFGDTPQVGALVFYDWGGSKAISGIDHIGLVIAVNGSTITTIEGNTGVGEVRQRERSATAAVVGYGYPSYDGASTDPSIPSVDPTGLSVPGLSDITAALNALANPHFWLRVGCTVLGMGLVSIGIGRIVL